jgi:hypothetical protein
VAHVTAVVARGDQSVLDGVYRFEVTETYLRSRGVTNREDIAHNAGLNTMTLAGGRYTLDWKGAAGSDREEGTYAVDGNRVTFLLSWVENGLPWTVEWRRRPGGDLEFESLTRGHPLLEALFTAGPWRRVR